MNLKKIILKIALTSVLFAIDCHGAFCDFHAAFSAKPEKLNRWEDMALEVEKWTDGLGMTLDPEIKETVIILNLLGFKTRQSCSGHAERALPYPWIDFDVYDVEYFELSDKLTEVQNQLREFEPQVEFTSNVKERVSQLQKESEDICIKMKMHIQKQIVPIYHLLEKFYTTKTATYDSLLCFPNEDFPRLQSLGAQWEKIRNSEIREKKLKEYQREMSRFTDFLIQKYLSLRLSQSQNRES